MTLTQEDRRTIVHLCREKIAANRLEGLSDWSDETQELFNLIRKVE